MLRHIWIQVEKPKRKAGRCLHLHHTYSIAEARAEDKGSSWDVGWRVVAWGPQMRLLIALFHNCTLLIWSEVTRLPYWSRLWAPAAELLRLGWTRLQRITQKGGYRCFRQSVCWCTPDVRNMCQTLALLAIAPWVIKQSFFKLAELLVCIHLLPWALFHAALLTLFQSTRTQLKIERHLYK